jgi:hypothetical protein
VGGKVSFNGMITLNDTGAFLWKKLEKGAEKEALAAALLDEYEVSPEKAEECRFVSAKTGGRGCP